MCFHVRRRLQRRSCSLGDWERRLFHEVVLDHRVVGVNVSFGQNRSIADVWSGLLGFDGRNVGRNV